MPYEIWIGWEGPSPATLGHVGSVVGPAGHY